MQKAGIPGLQIALIREGRVLWHRGFGIKNTQTGETVDERTVFEAASLTKPFFAYLVMKMVEAGELDLDTPLVEYAPQETIEQKYIRHSMDLEGFKEEWFRRITARQILSHSSGLPHGGPRRPLPVLFEPGSRYRYSADGYMYLQRIVEHLRGKLLHEIMQEEIIDPLGMEESCMVWQDRYAEQAAVGHDTFSDTTGRHRIRRSAHSAASLYTTAHDYALFVAAVMNGAGLKNETVTEMLAPQIDVAGGVFWSLGFGLEENTAGRAFWQWGDYGIFRNYIIADPKQRSGVVYFSNSFNGLAVCSELVTKSIGQEALGCLDLGYLQHDSPAYTLMWELKEKGPQAATAQLPALIKKYPDVFTQERVNGLGEIMENENMYPEAAAIYRCNAEQHPSSGSALYSLARASVLTGDLAEARKQFKASLSAPEDPAEQASVDWAMDYIKAMEDPAKFDEGELQKIAGDYGPRHLTIKDGSLFYSRPDAGTSEPRRLIAVSKDTFVIEGVSYFKLQVIFDEQGDPTKLVGIYESGQRDESPRDR
jgi:CubicO group peptidase (beta-lactamase class C family)